MRITFDPAKRAATLAARGLDFADAAAVFAGRHVTRQDDRPLYAEVRWITVGTLEGETVVVVWTERNASRRVISMRKADRNERGDFDFTLD